MVEGKKEIPFQDIFSSLRLKLKKENETKALSEALDLLEKKFGKDIYKPIKAKPSVQVKPAQGIFPHPEEVPVHKNHVMVFCDGGSRGNPGPGAWASLGQNCVGEILFEASSVAVRVTNNQMEMQGALGGLKWAMDYQKELKVKLKLWVFSDSRYLVDGMNQWVFGWKKRGWKKADGNAPENLALWKELDELRSSFEALVFVWVKGHNGHPQNEFCDQLLNKALNEAGF